MKKVDYLCYVIILLTLITTLSGLLYSNGGSEFVVENIYGDSILLYGDGVYSYNSLLKAGGNKGTDLAMLFVVIAFSIFTYMGKNNHKARLLQIGTLSGLLYYSSCLVFGVTFNRLFPVYVILFSFCLFSMIILLNDLANNIRLKHTPLGKTSRGTALFLMISGSSVLLWLEFIIPAILKGKPLSIIEIYTTEVTFVLDLGIVLPLFYITAYLLYKKIELGYKMTPVLLTFIQIVGLTVICQNILQLSMGIEIPIKDFVSLVASFVVLGVLAGFLNYRFLKNVDFINSTYVE